MSSSSKDYWVAEERIHRLEDAGRYLEAEQEARELVAADPNASVPQLLLAQALLLLGRTAEALVHAETACRLDPEDPASLMLLSECRRQTGDRRGAISAANRAVAQAPSDWRSHYTLAHAHLESPVIVMGSQSLDAVTEALRLAPANADIHNLHGIALERLGRADAARQAYQSALELNPLHPNALNNLGRLDVRRRPVKAAGLMTAATGLDPHSELFRKNVGIVAGNILVRLMRRLLIAGVVVTLVRIFGAPRWLMVVLVLAIAAAFAITLTRVMRVLPRGIRRSPTQLWRHLSRPARWYLSFTSVIVVLEVVIALAPPTAAVLAWVGIYVVLLVMRARRPSPGDG